MQKFLGLSSDRGCGKRVNFCPQPTLSAGALELSQIRLVRPANCLVVQHTVMQNFWACKSPNDFRAMTKVLKARNGSLAFRKGLHDVSITRTGRPILRLQGGRSVHFR